NLRIGDFVSDITVSLWTDVHHTAHIGAPCGFAQPASYLSNQHDGGAKPERSQEGRMSERWDGGTRLRGAIRIWHGSDKGIEAFVRALEDRAGDAGLKGSNRA